MDTKYYILTKNDRHYNTYKRATWKFKNNQMFFTHTGITWIELDWNLNAPPKLEEISKEEAFLRLL